MSEGQGGVPFNDVTRSVVAMRSHIDAAVADVLDRGWFVLGPHHDALEHELAQYVGVSDAVLVANGTDALQLALSAVGVGPSDAVLTAANAGGYTSTATRALGACPVYADVDPHRLQLTVDTLDAAVRREGAPPAAVVVTHLYGSVVEMTSIMAWAARHQVPVVEDCAQSMGARRDGQMAGSWADIATTSFYPTKNLGALGDGGAVFTSRPDLAQRVRQLRQYGWESKYRAVAAGGRNSRMDELQAAIVRAKLPFLDEWNARRVEIHRQYAAACSPQVRMVNDGVDSFVGHLAVAYTDDVAAARAVCAELGIGTDVHYPIPDHQQPLVLGTDQPELPVTERAAQRIFSVPLFPEMTAEEVALVCTALSRM